MHTWAALLKTPWVAEVPVDFPRTMYTPVFTMVREYGCSVTLQNMAAAKEAETTLCNTVGAARYARMKPGERTGNSVYEGALRTARTRPTSFRAGYLAKVWPWLRDTYEAAKASVVEVAATRAMPPVYGKLAAERGGAALSVLLDALTVLSTAGVWRGGEAAAADKEFPIAMRAGALLMQMVARKTYMGVPAFQVHSIWRSTVTAVEALALDTTGSPLRRFAQQSARDHAAQKGINGALQQRAVNKELAEVAAAATLLGLFPLADEAATLTRCARLRAGAGVGTTAITFTARVQSVGKYKYVDVPTDAWDTTVRVVEARVDATRTRGNFRLVRAQFPHITVPCAVPMDTALRVTLDLSAVDRMAPGKCGVCALNALVRKAYVLSVPVAMEVVGGRGAQDTAINNVLTAQHTPHCTVLKMSSLALCGVVRELRVLMGKDTTPWVTAIVPAPPQVVPGAPEAFIL